MATVSSLPHPTTAQSEYHAGFDLRCDEVFKGRAVDLSTLSRHERRGYDAACRAEADSGTEAYLIAKANRQREIDEAQDSASAANWPSAALW